MSDRETLRSLAEQLLYHDTLYYRDAAPEIDDASYDAIREQYDQLANALAIPPADRYTASFGDDRQGDFADVQHRIPMLSLEKLSPNRRDSSGQAKPLIDQLRDWHQSAYKELEWSTERSLPVLIEPKIDGISVSLTYRNGDLWRAATRGDGEQGDDITAQVRAAQCVPEKLNTISSGEIDVRGEIYLPLASFDALNDRLVASGDEPMMNPRNACAGLMKRKDVTELGSIGIKCFLYHVAWDEGVVDADGVPEYQSEVMHWLQRQGAHVYTDLVKRCESADEALAFCQDFAHRRAQLDFQIDGMVIKIDQRSLYDVLGATSHHPRWGIAYKFPLERKTTTLNHITVQIGKSGRLTPVAELDPVVISGTTVSRASLHNYKEVAAKDIRIGDQVVVVKAGEIIPQVLEPVAEHRTGDEQVITIPHECPFCAEPLVVEDNGMHVTCVNVACPGQRRERLIHFASRGAMDIDGCGPAVIDQLLAADLIQSPADLYRLSIEDIEPLERFGQRKASKLISAIEASKQQGLERLLASLSVRHCGKRMAENLAQYFIDYDTLQQAMNDYIAGDATTIEKLTPKGGNGPIEGFSRNNGTTNFYEFIKPCHAVIVSRAQTSWLASSDERSISCYPSCWGQR